MIAVDAVFSPVRRVRYAVEKTRVGDNVDLDKLTLTIDTDGTIEPAAAFEESAAILVTQYQALAGNTSIKADDLIGGDSDQSVDLLGMPVREAQFER